MQDNRTYTIYNTKKAPAKIIYPLKQKFVLGVIIIIAPILGLLFTWIGFRIFEQSRQETIEKARVVADQVVLTRQWITDCMGGVFVNAGSPGSKGVKLATDRQISAGDETFVFFTPSMVTQKLSHYSFAKKEYQFRLSSLTPINTDNAPNAFEEEALKNFMKEKKPEFYRFSDTTFEYMIPLYNTKGCTKCHTSETKHKTSIIGGLRITLPYASIWAGLEKNIWILAGAGMCITFVTIAVLVFLIHKLVLRPINELDEKSRLLSKGRLDARVNLDTNDELEKLGSNFNLMAKSLMQSRDSLEEKVAKATEDLARANSELLKLDRMKSDFLANMSHELRTPLTAVKGSINYLERTLKDPENLEYIQIIEKNISRLTRLISNLFDFTRLEAGAIEWEFETEDICQLIRDVIDITSPLAMAKDIRVTLDGDDAILTCIDLERMEQVLVNLLDNAIKFSAAGARISLSAQKTNRSILITITDQGPGIPEENLETIFRKFYTDSGSSGLNNQGAGMGLAISKAIVTAHGGQIRAESDGSFSRFIIELPEGDTDC